MKVVRRIQNCGVVEIGQRKMKLQSKNKVKLTS